MPCGKRPIRKLWNKPKELKVITPSKYEQNEASVKVHWKNVVRALELSYKDEQFWETQVDIVRDMVGPKIFQRIANVFDLPLEATKYSPQAEPISTPLPSDQFYKAKVQDSELRPEYSISDYEQTMVEEEEHEFEDESEMWTTSTIASAVNGEKNMKSRTLMSSKSITVSKSLSKLLSKSFSRFASRTLSTTSGKLMGSKSDLKISPDGTSANSHDDLDVNTSAQVM